MFDIIQFDAISHLLDEIAIILGVASTILGYFFKKNNTKKKEEVLAKKELMEVLDTAPIKNEDLRDFALEKGLTWAVKEIDKYIKK